MPLWVSLLRIGGGRRQGELASERRCMNISWPLFRETEGKVYKRLNVHIFVKWFIFNVLSRVMVPYYTPLELTPVNITRTLRYNPKKDPGKAQDILNKRDRKSVV